MTRIALFDTAPLVPHDDDPAELLIVDSATSWGVKPAPIAAVAIVTLEDEKAGAAILKPVGNLHDATGRPQAPVPAAAAATASVAVANFPVSIPPTIRFPDVFTYEPLVGLAGTCTLTVTVQLLPAAIVPPLNEIDVAPAIGAKLGVPHPDVEKFAGEATSICAGELGKLSANAISEMAVDAVLAI